MDKEKLHASTIVKVYSFLKLSEQAKTKTEKKIYDDLVGGTIKHCKFAGHISQFVDLFQKDRAEADSIFQLAAEHLKDV